jgi:hypothetical protein
MLLHYTTKTNKSRRLDSHQHEAVYGTAAFLNRATPAWANQVARAPGTAGAYRFELYAAALETACSPRSTLLFRVSGGNRTRHHDLHRVACQTTTPQTPSSRSPGWIRTSDLSHVTGMSYPLNDGTSTPTRIRTRNASFEARYDRPFHHRGIERKARESNPHLRWENRLSRAARPTVSGYLPSVDPPGIEPGSPVCRTGVVPLDHEPS